MRLENHVLCAVVALAVGCGVVACSTMPRRTPVERASDSRIATLVEAALLADPRIYARHIDVAVNRGVVSLGGFVWEADDFRLAWNDAASVPGVESVTTQMEIMRGGIAGTGR